MIPLWRTMKYLSFGLGINEFRKLLRKILKHLRGTIVLTRNLLTIVCLRIFSPICTCMTSRWLALHFHPLYVKQITNTDFIKHAKKLYKDNLDKDYQNWYFWKSERMRDKWINWGLGIKRLCCFSQNVKVHLEPVWIAIF